MKKDLIRYTNFGIYTLLFRMRWAGKIITSTNLGFIPKVTVNQDTILRIISGGGKLFLVEELTGGFGKVFDLRYASMPS